MKRLNQFVFIATLAVLSITTAASQVQASTLFSDNFTVDTTFNTSLWTSVKGTPRINNHRLLLESTPGNGCDATTKSSFIYPTTTTNKTVQVEIKTPSYAWHEDTSIGFETWSPGHEGIVVTAGCLGCINDTLASEPEWYIPIPNWSSIWSGDNVYLIKWIAPTTAGGYATAKLYVNGALACQYTGPQVPKVACNIRMNASNDFNDNLQVAYVTVSTN